jgi:hypothetical protein
LLYALGVGAGTEDLAFTTENSHGIEQQVLPTYAVIACLPFAAAAKIGTFNFAMLLHGSQAIRLFSPLPPAGKLSVVAEVADMQDKGEGKNAVVMLKATGTDPDSGQVVAETLTTAVIRGAGGFGGQPGYRCPPARIRPSSTGCPATATHCTATPGSRASWPVFRSRSCTGCARTASQAARWLVTWAVATRRRSKPLRRGLLRRCFPATP